VGRGGDAYEMPSGFRHSIRCDAAKTGRRFRSRSPSGQFGTGRLGSSGRRRCPATSRTDSGSRLPGAVTYVKQLFTARQCSRHQVAPDHPARPPADPSRPDSRSIGSERNSWEMPGMRVHERLGQRPAVNSGQARMPSARRARCPDRPACRCSRSSRHIPDCCNPSMPTTLRKCRGAESPPVGSLNCRRARTSLPSWQLYARTLRSCADDCWKRAPKRRN